LPPRAHPAGAPPPPRAEPPRCTTPPAERSLPNPRRFGSYEDARYQWYLTYEDTIDNLGRTFLGLTINCARCHDHKFDPISTEDYYALYGFFQSTRYPWPGIELDKVPPDLVPLVPPEQAEAVLKERRQQQAALDLKVKRLEEEKAAADTVLKEAEATKDAKEREVRAAAARQRVEEMVKSLQATKKERDQFAKSPLPIETAYAVAEGTRRVGNARVQLRGDPEKLGQ